jgi:hypothetical protein
VTTGVVSSVPVVDLGSTDMGGYLCGACAVQPHKIVLVEFVSLQSCFVANFSYMVNWNVCIQLFLLVTIRVCVCMYYEIVSSI